MVDDSVVTFTSFVCIYKLFPSDKHFSCRKKIISVEISHSIKLRVSIPVIVRMLGHYRISSYQEDVAGITDSNWLRRVWQCDCIVAACVAKYFSAVPTMMLKKEMTEIEIKSSLLIIDVVD